MFVKISNCFRIWEDHCRTTQSNSCTCKILFWILQYCLRDPDCHFGYLWWPVLVVCALLIDRLSHASRPCRTHVITGHSIRRLAVQSERELECVRTLEQCRPEWRCVSYWEWLVVGELISPLALAFTFTVLSTSTTWSSTPPIATSPSPIVTPKRTISTGKSSVSEGVVKLKLKTSFAKEVPIECEVVGRAQSSE